MQKYGVSNKFRQQDDLRAARGGLAHVCLGLREVPAASGEQANWVAATVTCIAESFGAGRAGEVYRAAGGVTMRPYR